jgi:hypothetical protein
MGEEAGSTYANRLPDLMGNICTIGFEETWDGGLNAFH